jgi:hypothetical protein
MRNYLLLWPIALALLLSGCGPGIIRADKEQNRQAKTFSPRNNLSNIYVYQEESSIFVGNKPSNVYIDGQIVGTFEDKTFFLFEVPPGSHIISTEWPGGRENGSKPVEVETEKGGNYFIRNEYNTGLVVHFKLHQIEENLGRKEVTEFSSIVVPENVLQQITAKAAATEKKRQEVAIQRNFARPEKITAPRPIAGNSGKYRSPFTVAGTVALWAQKPISGTDNGSDLAANVGGAVGRQVANKVFENIPFVGGIIGQSVGESAARAATKKNIEPELPGMDAVIASSDISFNSVDKLAVYMYAKNSSHGQYARVLALTQRVYPELQDAYTSAIEKASQASDSRKEKSADERLDALKKLKEKGLITDADYLAKKNKIIDAM